jgi:hypothetical protein
MAKLGSFNGSRRGHVDMAAALFLVHAGNVKNKWHFTSQYNILLCIFRLRYTFIFFDLFIVLTYTSYNVNFLTRVNTDTAL